MTMIWLARLLLLPLVGRAEHVSTECGHGNCLLDEETSLLHVHVTKKSMATTAQHGTGHRTSVSATRDDDDDPVEAPPKRDVYGCTCGPGSPSKGKNCCSGRFNAEGNNCIASNSVTCSSAKGKSLCCRDGSHGWCCPEGTACLEQFAGKFNDSACTTPQKVSVSDVATSWTIAGGGPGSPPGLKIEFTSGVERTATQTETKDISNTLTVGFSFGGASLSNSFTSEWSTVVEHSVTATETRKCTLECPPNYYLWVFRTSIQGIDTLPESYKNLFASCSAAICSPYGMVKKPACPFGYQDNQAEGFPCCTSLDWLEDPTDPDAPPVCSGLP